MENPPSAPLVLAAVLCGALVLSGLALSQAFIPFGPGSGYSFGFAHAQAVSMDWGSVYVQDVEATASYDLLAFQGRAQVDVTIVASNAEDVELTVVLAQQPCGRSGPPSSPAYPLDRKVVHYPGETDGAWTERVQLSARMAPALPASVYVEIEAENAIGPIFGECHDLSWTQPTERAVGNAHPVGFSREIRPGVDAGTVI